MPSEDEQPRAERVALWDAGYEIGSAWYKYGDERQKHLHDEWRGDPTSLAYQTLLIAGLFDQLANGDLVAFGFRIQPGVSDGPVQIPADTFSVNPVDDEVRQGIVEASGWRYERVTVQRAEPEPIEEAPDSRKLGLAEGAEPVGPKIGPSPSNDKLAQSNKSRGGRKDTWDLSRLVLQRLYERDAALFKLSAEKLLQDFQVEFRRLYPALKVGLARRENEPFGTT